MNEELRDLRDSDGGPGVIGELALAARARARLVVAPFFGRGGRPCRFLLAALLAGIGLAMIAGLLLAPAVLHAAPTARGTAGATADGASAEVGEAIATDTVDLRVEPTGQPTPDPLKPQPYEGGTPPTPADTVPANRLAGTLSTQWRLLAISADGRTLDILAVAGDGFCTTAAGVNVTETATSVEVAARSHVDWTQAACPSSLQVVQERVSLERPLRTRELLHAPVSPLLGDVTPP